MRKIMSRRKQSNPKPLLKREDEDFVEGTSTQTDDGETRSDTAQSGSPTPTPTTTPIQSPSACSTPPALSPDIEQTIEQIKITPTEGGEHNREMSSQPITNALPKLRLNTILASDPALQPEAKDIKDIRASSTDDDNINLDNNNKLDDEYNNHHHHHQQQHHQHSQQQQHHHHHQHKKHKLEQHNNDLKHEQQHVRQKHERTNNNNNNIIVRASPNIENNNLPTRVPVYMCEPCGIRFSSLSTLEAHQTYYCSHRKDADENSSSSKPSSTTETIGGVSVVVGGGVGVGGITVGGVGNIIEPTVKSIKTGKQYACTQCSYSADKKVSLNRHMRMHQTSPAPSSNTSNGDDPPTSQIPQVDRYCSECDIRFSSTKTYRAHKQHYCSSRHREGQPNSVTITPKPQSIKGGSVSPPEIIVAPKSPTPNNLNNNNNNLNPPQPYLALPTNPIVIVPYSFVRSASVLTGPLSSIAPGVLNPESTCFILQNGSLQPIAVSLTSSVQQTITATTHNNLTSTISPRIPTPISLQLQQQQQQQQQQTNEMNLLPEMSQTTTAIIKTSNKRDLATRESSSSSTNKMKTVSSGRITPLTNAAAAAAATTTTTTPLDLSVRRLSYGSSNNNCSRERTFSFSSMASLEHLETTTNDGGVKDNLSIIDSSDSQTPEQIVCAPSLPGSPPLTPSPKRRRSNSPRCNSSSISPNNNYNSNNNSNNSLNNHNNSNNTLQQQLQLHHQLQQQQQQQQHQQQPVLIRPILPNDLALRLNETTLNSISPQLLTKQSVELALRLSSSSSSLAINNSNNNNNNNSDLSMSAHHQHHHQQHQQQHRHQQQTPPLINIIPNIQTTHTKIGTTTSSTSSSSSSSITQQQQTIPPQIFVKQGVSKCKECNIVFCKYENYLAHKKHYCSARNNSVDTDLDGGNGVKQSPPLSPQLTATSPSGIQNVTVTGNVGSGVSGVGGGTLAYQQLICAACGIKFTSLDNLSAHQMYYCPKRIEIPIQTQQQQQQQQQMIKERCSKCKQIHEVGQQCVIIGQNIYKCPICDVINSSSTELRKHMETHGGVKAFRCSICRYKGNTLRGMRTHIRMHFDKKTSDFNEENYITCILEEDNVEVPPQTQTQLIINDTTIPPQLHYCDMCNYSSSYKGNVVRHIKLVHSSSSQLNSPITVGEGGESLIHNGELLMQQHQQQLQQLQQQQHQQNNKKSTTTTTTLNTKILLKKSLQLTKSPSPPQQSSLLLSASATGIVITPQQQQQQQIIKVKIEPEEQLNNNNKIDDVNDDDDDKGNNNDHNDNDNNMMMMINDDEQNNNLNHNNNHDRGDQEDDVEDEDDIKNDNKNIIFKNNDNDKDVNDDDDDDDEQDIIIDEPEITIKTEITEQSPIELLSFSPTAPTAPAAPVSTEHHINTINLLNNKCLSPDLIKATRTISPQQLQTSSSQSSSSLNNNNNNVAAAGPKYCKTCDIKFNYVNTFAAHKKFYCKSRINERDTGSSPTQPNNVARATEASVL